MLCGSCLKGSALQTAILCHYVAAWGLKLKEEAGLT